MDVQKTIEAINAQLDNIKDPVAIAIITQLLNIIEYQAQEIKELKAENQKLRNEISKLKGGSGKPNIRPQSNGNHSSEKDRKPRDQQKNNKKSKHKNHQIIINRIIKCKINRNQLPEDAVFKGYKSVIVQDIIIKTNNTKFKKEVCYSPSLNQSFMADLPAGYDGEFGPHIKSLIIVQHFAHKMPEPAIVQFLQNHGIKISAATVSRMITDNHEQFHEEKKDIVDAGIRTSLYQQLDDTSARINGKNNFTHVLCSPYYTAYFTRADKSRLTVLEILNQKPLNFQFNASAYALMKQMGLSQDVLTKLKELHKTILEHKELDKLLASLFPQADRHTRSRQIILEASAITAYLNSSNAVKILLTDDAPQFKQITELLALCWIHDGRHYKKLSPIIVIHQKKLKIFLDRYWNYYHELLAYKKKPSKVFFNKLAKEFDMLFSTITGYTQLDERIARTKLKKDSLLLVLKYPDLPLHNNNSELGARAQARYRDISFQTKNIKGTESKDTFMTIVETAKKLKVNAYNYIFDRISELFKLPSLANLVACNTS